MLWRSTRERDAARSGCWLTDSEWDGFALEVGSIFATREWLTGWQHHDPDRTPPEMLVSRRPDGSVSGLLLLSVSRSIPAVLRPAGPWPPPSASIFCRD